MYDNELLPVLVHACGAFVDGYLYNISGELKKSFPETVYKCLAVIW